MSAVEERSYVEEARRELLLERHERVGPLAGEELIDDRDRALAHAAHRLELAALAHRAQVTLEVAERPARPPEALRARIHEELRREREPLERVDHFAPRRHGACIAHLRRLPRVRSARANRDKLCA